MYIAKSCIKRGTMCVSLLSVLVVVSELADFQLRYWFL